MSSAAIRHHLRRVTDRRQDNQTAVVRFRLSGFHISRQGFAKRFAQRDVFEENIEIVLKGLDAGFDESQGNAAIPITRYGCGVTAVGARLASPKRMVALDEVDENNNVVRCFRVYGTDRNPPRRRLLFGQWQSGDDRLQRGGLGFIRPISRT